MGQLESLMELDITQFSHTHTHTHKKKQKTFLCLGWLSNENFIVLHHYVGKILKYHNSKLVHFTHQRTYVAFND
jgi:hypothetical protein